MPPVLGAHDGRDGRRWVDYNNELRKILKALNNGEMPDVPAFTTSEFPGDILWDKYNLPEILNYLLAPVSEYAGKLTYLLDENGEKVPASNPTPGHPFLMDHPVLPRRISVDVEGWLIETWRRLDNRISYFEIIARMTTDLGEYANRTAHTVYLPTDRSLANHCGRNCRQLLNIPTYDQSRDVPHQTQLLAVRNLTQFNITHNTILNRAVGRNDRLVRKKFVQEADRSKIRVENMPVTNENADGTTLPLDFFTLMQFPAHEGKYFAALTKARNLLRCMQARARCHGLGEAHWEKLGLLCKPRSWSDRATVKSTGSKLGGCGECRHIQPCDLQVYGGTDAVVDLTEEEEVVEEAETEAEDRPAVGWLEADEEEETELSVEEMPD